MTLFRSLPLLLRENLPAWSRSQGGRVTRTRAAGDPDQRLQNHYPVERIYPFREKSFKDPPPSTHARLPTINKSLDLSEPRDWPVACVHHGSTAAPCPDPACQPESKGEAPMNICKKFLFATGLLGLLCLLLPGPARADTIYTYTSQTLSDGSTFTITLDFTTPLAAGLSNVDESSNVSSWSMSDSTDGVTLTSTTNYLADLYLTTSNTATPVLPTNWEIVAYADSLDDPPSINSYDTGPVPPQDGVAYNLPDGVSVYYFNLYSPGSWTVTTTPEPGTLTLMIAGIVGLGLLAGVKRYRGNRLPTEG
jgi:PEP-CTERM motif